MLTVRSVAPSSSARRSALPLVRAVVPKPGIVTAMRLARGRLSRSSAFADISMASVESSPPETPTTSCFEQVCSIRFLSPIAAMVKISSQRSERVELSSGTKGVGEIKRESSVSFMFSVKGSFL